MPQLGESVTEGTITKWFVKIGDTVKLYEPIAEVMTDKVTAEIPSLFNGTIKELVKEDETFAVGEVICSIETVKTTSNETKEPVAANEAISPSKEAVTSHHPKEPLQLGKGARYSPAVLKLSQEHGIDLSQIGEGTGAGGRITRKDVLRFIESGGVKKQETEVQHVAAVQEAEEQLQFAEPASSVPIKSAVFTVNTQGDSEFPVTGVRKSIADKMVKSKHEIPHGWMMVEVDMTNLVNYRNSIKDEFKKKEGFNLTYLAFIVKAVAQGLKEYPN